MTNRSIVSELKWFLSSTFDNLTAVIHADNVNLYLLRQQYPNRIAYRYGRYRVRGRFGTFAWLTYHSGRGLLFIEASVPKFLTGQNLIGSENLRQLAQELVDEALVRARITLTPEEVRRYRSGDFRLTRVDYANHLWCGSHARSLIFMHALHRHVAATNCAFTQYSQQALSWGQHSKHATLKAYLKWPELQMKTREMGPLVRHRETLTKKAEGLVRFELTLRGRELKDRGLEDPDAWTPEGARQLLTERILALLPLDGQVIDLEEMGKLSGPTRMRLELFLRGQTDVFDRYPRAKLDDRREIREHTGIDIGSKLTSEEQSLYMQTLQEIFERGWRFHSWDSKWENMRKGKSGLM